MSVVSETITRTTTTPAPSATTKKKSSTTFTTCRCECCGLKMKCRRWVALVLVMVGLGIVVYAYEWRHYFAIALSPPSNFNPTRHYHQIRMAATGDEIQQLQTQLLSYKDLPTWLIQYTKWHSQARDSLLLHANSAMPPPKILLVSMGDKRSGRGGMADRLRSLPFLVWEAARTNRLFLMRWKGPCALEEFLEPPLGGLDWTVPANLDLSEAIWYDYYDEVNHHDNPPLLQSPLNNDTTIIKVGSTGWAFPEGTRQLVQQMNVTSWSDPVFSHIYKLMLKPSPPVQQLLHQTMKRLNLVAGQYDAVHLRARYPGLSDKFQKHKGLFARNVDADGIRWTRDAQTEMLKLAQHGVDCIAHNHHANHQTTTAAAGVNSTTSTKPIPVYFASDTNDAVKLVSETHSTVSGDDKQQRVVGFVTPYEKLHLDLNDRIALIRKTPPSAFYPAFVDLWILSQARCLSLGNGGFGIFASIIGETSCVVFHQENSFRQSPHQKFCPYYENEDKEEGVT